MRTVLAPLFGGPNDGPTLSAAIAVSEILDAHLEACFVRPDPEDVVPYFAFGAACRERIGAEYRQSAETRGKKVANRVRRKFNAACKKHGIAKVKHSGGRGGISARWVEIVGDSVREVPSAARFCDISVFAGSRAHFHGLFPNALDSTLTRSGHPILFIPDGSSFNLQRIAVAWDGSVPAVHAVDAACAFFKHAEDIQVLSVEEVDEDTTDPQRLVEYLAWRDINATGKVVPNSRGAVGRALLNATQEMDASLLVIGGYAHPRFEETVFGGTTLYAMRHTHIPLLMMH